MKLIPVVPYPSNSGHMVYHKTIKDLKLNAKKCSFFQNKIKFLGHVIGINGILPNDDKILKVRNFPDPLQKFIKEFAKITKPLNLFLKKNKPYHWIAAQEKAFQTLKTYLITSPVLQHPDFSKPFYLHIDASILGLGAVLAQLDKDNKEYVIAYTIRMSHYHLGSKTFLSIFGIQAILLIMDYLSLQWLRTSELKGK
ncbi:10388_t:CDS:2 [Racocetra fulgida]|uniref:10388_t:CDS:1 n=1 Tax=Racocetra fulgida TaxID=60492 RepID=A0A9N8W805_9GLOM|nr:10388_t:CDS:2 [Racocetra fulgida]